MSKSKNIKKGFEISPEKIPKSQYEPDNFRNSNVSWQFHKIDFESKWCLRKINHRISFFITKALTDELLEAGHDDTFTVLDSFSGKEYDSIDSFIEKLNIKCKGQINSSELMIIIKHIQRDFFWREIYPHMRDCETMTWTELEKATRGDRNKSNNHFIPISKFPRAIQKRLEENYKMNIDFDEIYSLRFEGELRIYGIRKFNYLQIIWIDLEHEIYPVPRG